MAKFRVGIIACGTIANHHARAWRAIGDRVDLVAIADSNAAARDEFGARWGVDADHRYADYREMLDKERLDIVSVCSWHGQHAEMTIAAAARKPKLVLCEKPMATSLQEADAMIVAARRNGVKLAIGHMRRFFAAWEEARRLVAAGAIGQPQRAWSVIRDGLLNWGTHTIDGLRFALGDPNATWVMGAVERRTDRYERAMRIEDCCMGLIAFDNGCQCLIESDLTDWGSINYRIEGTEGAIAVDENEVSLFNAETRGWQKIEVRQNAVFRNVERDAFVDQANGIVDWLEDKIEDYRGEARHGRATLEILLAIYESARRHQVIRLPMKTLVNPLDLMVEQGQLPVEFPGRYDIRSILVRGEGMSWL